VRDELVRRQDVLALSFTLGRAEELGHRNELLGIFRPEHSQLSIERDQRRCNSRAVDELRRAAVAENGVELIGSLRHPLAQQTFAIAIEPAMRALANFAAQRSLSLQLHAADASDRLLDRGIHV